MNRIMNVFLAGDSTMQTYGEDQSPQAGWGQYIDQFFEDHLTFHNHAIGGRSSKTFVTELRLEAILNEIQENDLLLIQMGHNDSTISKPERYTEPYTTYKEYLKEYIDGATSKKAIPILITPVGRLHYKDGEYINDFPDYCQAMKDLAKEKGISVIDLNTISRQYYEQIGYDQSEKLFMISANGTDCTHFTKLGAEAIAKLVAQELKELISL